jgi:hypothetical protein
VLYAGESKNSTNEYLVRGTFCAKSVGDEAKQTSYYNAAYFSFIKYDQMGKIVDESDVKKGAMEAAKRAELDASSFGKCLDSKEAEAFVDANRKYFADLKLDQAPAFLLNGRRLAVPPQLNVSEIVAEILEETGVRTKPATAATPGK